MKLYQEPSFAWNGRDDGMGLERIHQQMKTFSLQQVPLSKNKDLALLGFCSDEGVRRNGGRRGAAEAPDGIRKALANLSWDPSLKSSIDVGDVLCLNEDLESAQEELASSVDWLLKKDYFPVVLGGGHETAWGHFKGLHKHAEKILIVNFDAHLDLRPLPQSLKGSSGTPFTQIAEFCRALNLPFHYLCFGVQKHSETKSISDNAKRYGVSYIYAEDMHQGLGASEELLSGALETCDGVYLSLCMDVFAQAFAPGVSAPQAFGLHPMHVLSLLKKIKESKKLLSADIVEFSPPYDRDQATAKLAAALVRELF